MKKIPFPFLWIPVLLFLPGSGCVQPAPQQSDQHLEAATRLEKRGQWDGAMAEYNKAIKRNPDQAMAYHNRGLLLARKGSYREAVLDLTRAIERDPENPLFYYNRGVAWEKQGQYDRALKDFTMAIQLNPEQSPPYVARGIIWDKTFRYGNAIHDFRQALRITPDHGEALGQLAWIFATCPESRFRDGARALELAKKALSVESTPYRLDTLAAAYAESGRFTKAVAIQEEVIDRLRRSGDPALVADCLERLNAYRLRTPWREK